MMTAYQNGCYELENELEGKMKADELTGLYGPTSQSQ